MLMIELPVTLKSCLIHCLTHSRHSRVKSEVKVAQSCLTLCDPIDCPWNSPGQNTGVGSLSLLRGIFPIQELNSGLSHCKWILHQLSHHGNPRILEWVAYPFSSGSFPTQELNWVLPHYRWILYQLSYQGSKTEESPQIGGD